MISKTTGAITKKIARHPPHVQAGIEAYRAALDRREDWHTAVAAAIEAAVAALSNRVVNEPLSSSNTDPRP